MSEPCREAAARQVAGRLAVLVNTTVAGCVGAASLLGADVSRSLGVASGDSMVLDAMWSGLLILAAVLVAASALTESRVSAHLVVILERVGVLFFATGMGVFIAGVLVANGLTGTLMTVAMLGSQSAVMLLRQAYLSPRLAKWLRGQRARLARLLRGQRAAR